MGLERAALRVAAALALAVLATAGSARAGTAHRNPCHSRHTCPSDHHTYVWNGLSCTSYPDERLPSDTRKWWSGAASTGVTGSDRRPAAVP